jgi:hypothetical protein
MLARSPEELDLFNKMDEEMGKRENKEARVNEIMKRRPGLMNYKRINYRLTQDWEVPEWMKVKPINKEEEKETIINLGKRNRKEVVAMDNLTDE